MNQSRTNCADDRIRPVFFPLKFAGKRRSKGQRYYPRPPKASAGSWDRGLKVVRSSCLAVRTADSVPVL
jgi:hypothetical protein